MIIAELIILKGKFLHISEGLNFAIGKWIN